jgi:excisionase family DNA binding protein
MSPVRFIRDSRSTVKAKGLIPSVHSQNGSVLDSTSSLDKPKAETLRTPVASVLSPPPEAAPVSEPKPSGLHSPVPKPLDRHRERTLTVKEAAFRLGKSEDAIYKWLRSGRLEGWQPGGRWCSIVVLESSVEKALLYSFDSAASNGGPPAA